MTAEEFDAWRPGTIADYAAAHVRSGSMEAAAARSAAEAQFAQLLPDGPTTADHQLLIPESDGQKVGMLWLHTPADGRAFVYDIEVDEAMRGRGFGRAIMLAAEECAREHGATAIRLHVFGDNAVARRLYDSLGYAATDVIMAKPLDRG